MKVSLTDRNKVSNRALEGDIVKFAVKWSNIGDTFKAKSVIPLGVHLIRIGLKSTVGALDSFGGGLMGNRSLEFDNQCIMLTIQYRGGKWA